MDKRCAPPPITIFRCSTEWRRRPCHSVPPGLLYRGQNADNRKYRTHGISWSVDQVVVRSLTVNNHETITRNSHELSLHGMVVMETSAPAQAILCSTLDYRCRGTPTEQDFMLTGGASGRCM